MRALYTIIKLGQLRPLEVLGQDLVDQFCRRQIGGFFVWIGT